MAESVELFKSTDIPSMDNFNKKIQEFNSLITKNATLISAGAKIQTGHYIGTGKYGRDNPCSVTCDFVPAIIMSSFPQDGPDTAYTGQYFGLNYPIAGCNYLIPAFMLSTDYRSNFGLSSATSSEMGNSHAKVSEDRRTVYWFSTVSAEAQNNKSGFGYYWIAIGS